MKIEILKESGLTHNEALVYQALLKLGPSLAGRISQKTGLHRRTVYDTTEMLIKKGLIGYILKNNRKLFEAASPERFIDILREKENSINEILPEMMDIYKSTKEKQETNFYKGRQGLKTIFQDQLEDNKEVLILGASQAAFEVLPFYFKWYDKNRIKKRVKVKIITSQELKKKIPLSKIRTIPQKYTNPLAINIYKDKVAIILWKKDALAIVIKNKEVAEGYKQYFELMWKIAKNQ
ncbi:MAG: helix-turn-helix domain-containing protein [archaeon]